MSDNVAMAEGAASAPAPETTSSVEPTGSTTPSTIPIFTEPKNLSISPSLITFVTDPSDPIFGVLADKIRQNEKADPALVESMKEEGFTSLIQAVQNLDGRLIGITGRRRVKAATEAGVNVYARVVPLTQITSLSLFARMIRENEVRKEDDLFNRAEKAKNYRQAILDQSRPQIPNDEALGETKPDPNWEPSKAQFGEANRATMLAFGFASSRDIKEFKAGSGKYFELLNLTAVIESVRKAYREGWLGRTVILKAGVHKMTPAAQQKWLDRQQAKFEAENKPPTVEGTAAAIATGSETADTLSKTEQLALADTMACPASVKAFVKLAHGKATEEQLGGDVSWLTIARAELANREAAAARDAEAQKIQREHEKAASKALKEQQKADEKAAKEAERLAVKAQKAREAEAKAEAKKAEKAAKATGGEKAPKLRSNVTVVEV